MHSILVLMSTVFIYISIIGITGGAIYAPNAKPGCPTHCGNVTIPFPFGIGQNCYINKWFELECLNATAAATSLILKRTKLEVLNISVNHGTLQAITPVTLFNCPNKKEGGTSLRQLTDLKGTPFSFGFGNIFAAVSCGAEAIIDSSFNNTIVQVGCKSTCSSITNSSTATKTINSCDGVDCCKSTIPSPLTPFQIVFRNSSSTKVRENECKYAFFVDETWFGKQVFPINFDMDSVPVNLDWYLDQSSDDWEHFSSMGELVGLVIYTRVNQSSKFRCVCKNGFRGNPYLSGGCKDIDECSEDPMICPEPGATCINIDGSYTCEKPERDTKLLIGIGSGIGSLLVAAMAWGLYKIVEKIKDSKRKKSFFKRNGGLLLQQETSAGKPNFEKTKVFNSKEVDKATENFNVNRVLGRGGQGTVYKGMLADGKIVAVKKSTVVDEAKVSEFINEVVILSQINHRNVVKLLGCCLETEVPLLVYEFIPNGTLSQFIHDHNGDLLLNWQMRLKIAIEVAEALSYLHSAVSFPIYHRDIKSANILLDENFTAKIADFGTSRSVTLDQTHLTTEVYGTFGYLDPEYFQSNQYTEKSDVYSLGVVLVELLTGEKAISLSRSEESLATYFLISMQKNRLRDILHAQVLEGPQEEILIVANLAKRCLDLNGKNRPTMKEICMELEVTKMKETATSNNDQGEAQPIQTLDVIEASFVYSSSSSLQEIPLLSFKSCIVGW
ncbi:hypothetical protein F8388_013716 [Cannabis sativa]|uniref:Protein kinase domain-containing protein n=1 Tax=Cannabis sativa TaxID=3483 RepID=A0A7J6HSQ7_CANSA|nr:hypothetical protein F8388_013716 [Cannabis sativa]KAF4398322.1 hypothetical protein G4B88_007601 [Cannabis sativa]